MTNSSTKEHKSLDEFLLGIRNRKGCPGRVRGSWGVYDAYKAIRKHHWFNIGRPLKEKEFYTIIRSVNILLADEIAKGTTVTFPCRMGRLELTKHEAGVKMDNGKLKITYPIDWSETLKLWYEDSEAHRQKTLLRNENPWVYRVKYNVYPATFENKLFYQFTLNSFIQKALSRNICQGKTDTAMIRVLNFEN